MGFSVVLKQGGGLLCTSIRVWTGDANELIGQCIRQCEQVADNCWREAVRVDGFKF